MTEPAKIPERRRHDCPGWDVTVIKRTAHYDDGMSRPYLERPDLPEFMTWEELEQLPDEIAEQIELWDGRVVWVRRGPNEHQVFTRRMTNALEESTRAAKSVSPHQCWRAELETNVFLGRTGKSDFVTPDFLVFECPDAPYQDVRADRVLMVGEVLSPSNTQTDIEAKKGRYSGAGIPWYWEVLLAHGASSISMVRAFALETGHGLLPAGVHPLRTSNYLPVGEWTPADSAGIVMEFPFSIHIPWDRLQY